MKHLAVLLTVGAFLALTLTTTLSQELPPGPTPVYRTSFEVTDPPGEVITIVLDFAPGAWTPLHQHGGSNTVLVVEGEMTFRNAETGEETTYTAGESWVEHPGHPHAAGNNTDANARVVFTILLPEGEEVTTVVE
jgi:quercetin dioxygenase-like cupin family protein